MILSYDFTGSNPFCSNLLSRMLNQLCAFTPSLSAYISLQPSLSLLALTSLLHLEFNLLVEPIKASILETPDGSMIFCLVSGEIGEVEEHLTSMTVYFTPCANISCGIGDMGDDIESRADVSAVIFGWIFLSISDILLVYYFVANSNYRFKNY